MRSNAWAGPPSEFTLKIGFQGWDGHAELLKQLGNQAVFLTDQRQQEVFAIQLLVVLFLGRLLGGRDSLLGLDRKLLKIHLTPSFAGPVPAIQP